MILFSIQGDKAEICSFVNDSTHGNCVMKTIGPNRIGLFALKFNNIKKGEEICYSYDSGRRLMPWRVKDPLQYSLRNSGRLQCVDSPEEYCPYCFEVKYI